ncbi:MAG: hypothetical protein Ta2B_30250 [Termitinemataceae bacterium]|nr:MAG: hypothetical protein Ta2B_30250 [Termitinemataceae bacterium]
MAVNKISLIRFLKWLSRRLLLYFWTFISNGKKQYKVKLYHNEFEELKYLRDRLNLVHSLRYPKGFIEIGDFTYGSPAIGSDNNITNLKIGKFCSIANDVKIMLGGEHRSDWITTYPFNVLVSKYNYIEGHPKTKGNIKIGNDVWIGRDVTIMSGVTIGDGCVVGANSLVTRNLPEYTICGGVPAKVIKKRFPDQIIDGLRKIKWWDWPDEDIFKVIPILQSNNFENLIKYYEDNISKIENTSKSSVL